MSDIVEWLREMQGDYEGSATFIDYAGHYKEAADRIEALERDQAEDDERIALLEQHAKNQKARIEDLEDWQRKGAEDIITLGAMVARLEAALREIIDYRAYTAFPEANIKPMKDIARRALEEGK